TRGIVSRLVHPDLRWETIGEVHLMFSHLDRNLAGSAFPEENFVFSDNFRTILRNAGLDALAAPAE
ncbi:MAG: hypothetical protein KDA25_05630, partial [Phycisphaerales bacterium]|nr:hypothetical protein [Phycisphaerales bacterium]